MENKEYKNESWYKTLKKRMLGIALIIFGAGLLLGFSFIMVGNIKIAAAKKEYNEYKEMLKQEVSKQVQNLQDSLTSEKEEKEEKEETALTEEETSSKKAELEAKIKELEAEKAKLEEEKEQTSSDVMKTIEITQKIIELDSKIFDLKDELNDLDKKDFVMEGFTNALTAAKTNEDNFKEAMQNPLFKKLFGILGSKLNSTIEYTYTTGRFIGFYIIGCSFISTSAVAAVVFYFVGINVEVHRRTDKKEKKEE